MLNTPEIVQITPKRTALIRFTVPREAIQEAMEPGLAELRAALAAQGIAADGPWFTVSVRPTPPYISAGILVE